METSSFSSNSFINFYYYLIQLKPIRHHIKFKMLWIISFPFIISIRFLSSPLLSTQLNFKIAEIQNWKRKWWIRFTSNLERTWTTFLLNACVQFRLQRSMYLKNYTIYTRIYISIMINKSRNYFILLKLLYRFGRQDIVRRVFYLHSIHVYTCT